MGRVSTSLYAHQHEHFYAAHIGQSSVSRTEGMETGTRQNTEQHRAVQYRKNRTEQTEQ